MQFSDYTLSGLTFLGGGIDIAPPGTGMSFSWMYGRFSKAVPYADSLNYNTEQPAFERWGYGGKLSMGGDKHKVDLLMFRASDKRRSIPDPGFASGLSPEENLVLGFCTENTLTNSIKLKTEFSRSAFTKDTRLEETEYNAAMSGYTLGMFTPRYSSTYNNALNTNISYAKNSFSIGIGYKRIDPEYQSLGTTYLTNDAEDITLQASKAFLKNKLNVNGSFGTQRNNLERDLETTNKRWIGSFNLVYAISKAWNTSFSYSNFTNTTGPSYVNIRDTLHFAQVSNNLSGILNYTFGNKNLNHAIGLMTAVQEVNTLNETATIIENMNSGLVNTTVTYNLNFIPRKLVFTLASNYNSFNQSADISNATIGPVIGVSKGFSENKFRVNGNIGYLATSMNGNTIYNTTTIRAGCNYKVSKHHSFRMSAGLMSRNVADTGNEIYKDFNEYTITLNYGYVF
jgi:hypothetical protein